MGFWHTGYIEFHESVGLPANFVPQPTTYPCNLCKDIFSGTEELRKHRFEIHPLKRPVLFFRGKEVGSAPVSISREITCEDFQSLFCDSASVNGASVALSELGYTLSKITNDKVTLALKNEGVEAIFVLNVFVSSERDLNGVDQCFVDLARRGRLDSRAVEDFIQSAKQYKTAINYYDGICEYFYGVLAKERESESTLEFDEYRKKYNRAIEKLQSFDRPISNLICSLVSFHFNHFNEATLKIGTASRVGVASLRYKQWLDNNCGSVNDVLGAHHNSEFERLLTDNQTEQLLQWSILSPDELKKISGEVDDWIAKDLPELDRSKLRILMAESFAILGDIEKAKFYSREMVNSSTLGSWVDRLLDRISDEGQKYVN